MTTESALRELTIPGWDARDRRISYVGHGESFDAWKIEDVDGALPPVLARVARRTDLPKPMENEAGVLRELREAGVAPLLHSYDSGDDNPLGMPYMVTSFVAGQEKPPAEWSLDEARAVIEHAARLHSATARPGSSSGIGWLEGSLEYWRATASDALSAEPTASVLAAAERFVRANESAFDRLEEIALVHGDLITGNVLLDEGVPNFVDWEWAEVDDVARDLALIGGQTFGGGTYMELTDTQVRELVECYAAARDMTSRELDDLAVRRDVWMVLDRMFSSVHSFVTGSAEKRESALAMQRSLGEWLEG